MSDYQIAFLRGMLDAAFERECPYGRGSQNWEAWLDGKIAYENP